MTLFLSCNKQDSPDCFQTAGEYATVRRELEPFTLIELHDYVQLELFDTNVHFIEISAPENLITDIATELSGGKLEIRNDNTCNWVRSFKNKITVRIYAPAFHEIENFGTGNITSINQLQESRLKIENRHSAGLVRLDVLMDTLSLYIHTGVSDALLTGSATTTEIFNQGLGFVDARDLQSQYTFCNNSSINDIYINAEQYLYALIQFSGNIFYSGSPNDVDAVIEGDGEVIQVP